MFVECTCVLVFFFPHVSRWCRQQKVLYVSLDSISEHLLSNHWRCICWCIKCWEFKMNFRRNVDSFGVSRSMHFAFRNFAFDLKNLILFIEFLNLNYNDNNSWKKSLVMGFMNVFFFRCPSISLVGSAVRNCVCVCVCLCVLCSKLIHFSMEFGMFSIFSKMVKFLAFRKIKRSTDKKLYRSGRSQCLANNEIATNFWPRYYQHGYRRILNI